MKTPSLLCALIGLIVVSTQATAYEITIDNKAVVFDFINITCNGGTIKHPPDELPLDQTNFEVQSDAQRGCMLRYDDGRGSILGIQIHQGQADCSNQGGILSYDCTYRNHTLTIRN